MLTASCWKRNSNTDSIECLNNSKTQNITTRKCFLCNRLRQISPILKNVEREYFPMTANVTQTRDTIKETKPKQVHFVPPISEENQSTILNLSTKRNNFKAKISNESVIGHCLPKNFCNEETQTDENFNHFNTEWNTSLQDSIITEKYGNLQLSKDTEPNHTLKAKDASTDSSVNTTKEKTQSPITALRWLWRSCQEPSRKRKRPKTKLQAVIYKTYFVRWTKPVETIWNGYGVRPVNHETRPTFIRRCRSATF